MRETSTETAINTPSTTASSGYDLNAGALKNAITKILENMGENYQKYLNKEITWAQCCNSSWFQRKCLSAVGHYKHPMPSFSFDTQTGSPFFYHAASACVCHV